MLVSIMFSWRCRPARKRSPRGGCWFAWPGTMLHLGIEAEFQPARKAHPALRVRDLEASRHELVAAGVPIVPDGTLPSVRRFYVDAPHGSDIYGILSSTTPSSHVTLPHPSDALDYIAQRLISTQAVRDNKDRFAACFDGGVPCFSSSGMLRLRGFDGGSAIDRGCSAYPAMLYERSPVMPARYPAVVFAPNGGATFIVQLDPSRASPSLPTPMPAMSADGRLAAPWRWGGHQVDIDARVVHFAFVNRLSAERWTADVPFE